MKKFTIITKDGSKWLRPVLNPSDTDQLSRFFQNAGDGFEDLPYIGTRPEGTTGDEGEVKEVVQYRQKDNENADWKIWTTGVIDWDCVIETRTAYTDAESHDRHISGWTHVSDALPEHLETVWLSNGKGFTTLGCLVWTEDGWHWAATNGVIYEENGRIVSECESDDIDAEYWHRLPAALRIDKEVKP